MRDASGIGGSGMRDTGMIRRVPNVLWRETRPRRCGVRTHGIRRMQLQLTESRSRKMQIMRFLRRRRSGWEWVSDGDTQGRRVAEVITERRPLSLNMEIVGPFIYCKVQNANRRKEPSDTLQGLHVALNMSTGWHAQATTSPYRRDGRGCEEAKLAEDETLSPIHFSIKLRS